MARACSACGAECQAPAGALAPLLTDELSWLWVQLARAADRRGDARLASGSVRIEAPEQATHRAPASALLGVRLAPGQRRRVDLERLAARLDPLTPGLVAAHAVGRPLAAKAAVRTQRTAAEASLRTVLAAVLPAAADGRAWDALRRAGWVARLAPLDDALAALARVAAVLERLPAPGDPPVDRRLLAQAATGSPHELDAGQLTAGLCLAVLSATGRIPAGLAPRDAWAAAGVCYDDIIGGLTVVGIAPAGWALPAHAPVTLTPRTLAGCSWPPGGGRAVFVTENPSVLGAAAELATAGLPRRSLQPRVVCTSGTPSRLEIAALSRLAAQGWRLHVRADFDDAGLAHVAAILDAAEGAVPWRMGARDYLEGRARAGSSVPLRLDRLGATHWDPSLRLAMAEHATAVYEECFLPELLADLGVALDPPSASHR